MILVSFDHFASPIILMYGYGDGWPFNLLTMVCVSMHGMTWMIFTPKGLCYSMVLLHNISVALIKMLSHMKVFIFDGVK